MAKIGPDFLAISLVCKELCYYILYEFSRYDLNISYLASGGWNKLIFIVLTFPTLDGIKVNSLDTRTWVFVRIALVVGTPYL